MGGTIILWQALRGGQIDVYPEYTGTIGEEILKTKQPLSQDEMRKALAKFGVGMSADLGFNNTYALVMRRTEAERLGIRSDQRSAPPPGTQSWADSRVSRPAGWLASARRRLWPNDA